MNRRGFLSLAPLILAAEPRKAYSFLWERETERERMIRLIRDDIERFTAEHLSEPVYTMPPGFEVQVLATPESLIRDRRLTARITVRPVDWIHAQQLLAVGFEFA